METANLKKFAQSARRSLIEQVSNKLDLVLAIDSKAKREHPEAVKNLEELISKQSTEQVIEKVAYIWFNRFCALRFMDVNHYTKTGIVSPAPDQLQPEILSDAKMGHIDESMVNDDTQTKIRDLLDGTIPARDPQSEAYRTLIVAACNYYHSSMPFLFERISDYTELLMPDDLLSSNSILAHTREVMTEETCKDVEVIGWLYQFYISEKKDEVINRRSVVSKEEIPAATQLFTPKWIVQYMVENSLGRLWMLNHPNSKLTDQMDYYIKPEQPETDFLQIQKPEELKICDPACGSGHMLTYAFDLLYSIYEEEGYQPSEIPTKILTHNLYGIEIDERAGELAAFALTMKARDKQKRFFNKKIQPNICVLENIDLTIKEEENDLFITNNTDQKWQQILNSLSKNINREHLIHDLNLFQEADNFGSLLKPQLKQEDIKNTIKKAEKLLQENCLDVFLNPMLHQTVKALKQADYLTQKYQVAIANPPYAGSRYMNVLLRIYAQSKYPASSADMFAMFIERILDMTLDTGIIAILSPYVWMYIYTFEKFRGMILNQNSISTLVRLEYNAFEPACVPVASWIMLKGQDAMGVFIDLSEFKGYENQAPRTRLAINDKSLDYVFHASTRDFVSIPSMPVAYQTSFNFRKIFAGKLKINEICEFTGSQNITGDNNKYLRKIWEIRANSVYPSGEWVKYAKGGGARKWFGLLENVVDWSASAREFYKKNTTSNMLSKKFWFRHGVTYSMLTSNTATFRVHEENCIYDKGGPSFHPILGYQEFSLLACNCVVAVRVFDLLNPTLNLQVKDVKTLPLPDITQINKEEIIRLYLSLTELSKNDWNSNETSWGFTTLHLIQRECCRSTISDTYSNLRSHWLKSTLKMQRLEEENNRIFIDAYGLQDELTPEVSLLEITLTCNPHYRYKGKKNEAELEALLLADTMKEFISYSVGCMFGRYSLDKPGLILANQGETNEDYLAQIPLPSFSADDDNVIPILDGDWFSDDVTERFFKFLHVTFGDEHYEENLQFIEKAIGKSIRKYFLKDFYKDHVRRYKKRPIYWMFSSPKGSFNVLIYMHRYQPDTVSVILNGYLREFRAKLNAKLTHLEKVGIGSDSSKSEKAKAIKEIEKLKKVITEVEDYERDVLYPLATKQVEIDLDDGVKVNYNKFGHALKKVTGLTGK